jgi:hypothetical protein
MVRRCNLAEVEGDGVASLCELGVYASLERWLSLLGRPSSPL